MAGPQEPGPGDASSGDGGASPGDTSPGSTLRTGPDAAHEAATLSTGGLALAVAVARRFHLEGASKVEIAQEMGITRFKVARLLDAAREAGLVRTVVSAPAETDQTLEDELRRRYGLRHALVAADTGDDAVLQRVAVGRLAAEWFEHLVAEDDVVGLAWGRAMSVMYEHWRRRVPATFVQVAGSLVRPDVAQNGPELVSGFARRTGGRATVFYAPLVVADAATAEVLRHDDAVAAAVRDMDRLTKAVVSVGAWHAGGSTVFDALDLQQRNDLRRRGVRAEVTGLLLDEGGDVVGDLADRTLSVTAQQLRRTDHVVALAAGTQRATALRAVLRSGLLAGLVTHSALAAAVLADE
ncbi:sugar-binding domain-containing protein [Pseudokineococcus basanitobsidens]|uniref:Sugar-binding domain-containing protein n=1 Tax=Pseudokineococcus basanitobsidens TaxID=1926649 RepID=A0ABU8RG77_9ACTN